MKHSVETMNNVHLVFVRLVVVTLTLLTGVSVHAQALSFDDVLAQALVASPTAGRSRHDEAIASHNVRSARARLLPVVQSSASATHNDRRIEIPVPEVPGVDVDTPVFQYQNVARLAVAATVPLVEPAGIAGLRAARLGSHGASEQRRLELLVVERSAVELFAQWVQSDRQHAAAGRRLQLARAHHEQLLALLEQGAATILDVRRTELAVVEAELAYADAARLRDAAEHQTALLISSEGMVSLTGTLPPPPDDAPELRAASELRVAQAQAATRAAGLSYAPQVVAGANANWVSAPYIDDRNYAWQVQAALQWTLFAGGARRANQRIAEERQALAALALDTLALATVHERELALAAVNSANAERLAAAERVELAGEVALLTHRSFELGVATSTDVLAADFALADAEVAAELAELAETLAHWRVRWAGLDAAVR